MNIKVNTRWKKNHICNIEGEREEEGGGGGEGSEKEKSHDILKDTIHKVKTEKCN